MQLAANNDPPLREGDLLADLGMNIPPRLTECRVMYVGAYIPLGRSHLLYGLLAVFSPDSQCKSKV